MSIETPDVLVVGLGPAGSRAAAVAATAGLNVIALERRKTAGSPVQCAEFVPRLIEHDVGAVRTVTAQKVSRMLTFVGAQPPQVTDHFQGLMIDRDAFDRLVGARSGSQRRRMPLRRNGLVYRCGRDGDDIARRALASARSDRRRRSALTGRRRGRTN